MMANVPYMDPMGGTVDSLNATPRLQLVQLQDFLSSSLAETLPGCWEKIWVKARWIGQILWQVDADGMVVIPKSSIL